MATGRKQLESRLQAWFISACIRAGAFAVKLEAVGRRGFPDVLVIHNGECSFIELKASPRFHLSEGQTHMQRKMRAAKACVFTCYGKEECDEWLRAHFGELP
jgi:hypothetical protein